MVFPAPPVLVAWYYTVYLASSLERILENGLIQTTYFPDEKTEAQNVKTTCLKSRDGFVIEPRHQTYCFSSETEA